MTVAPFDFRSPPPAGRSAPAVSDWLNAACRRAGRDWAKCWPFAAELRLGETAAARPADFLRALSESAFGFTLQLNDDLDRLAFLTLDRPLLLGLVTCLLGEPLSELPADRDLTAVERSLIDYLMPQLLEPLRRAWPGAETPRIAVTAVGAPRLTCKLPLGSPAIAATLHLRGPFGEIPFTLLLPRTGWPDEAVEAPATPGTFASAEVETVLREMPLEFSVDLGRVRLSLTQLSALKPDDVLVLDQRIADPLSVRVNGAERFAAWAGAIGRHRAVRIHAVRKPATP